MGTLAKNETKKRLMRITEMNDTEIEINADYIRTTAESAYCLIRQWEGIVCKKVGKRSAIFNKITESVQS